MCTFRPDAAVSCFMLIVRVSNQVRQLAGTKDQHWARKKYNKMFWKREQWWPNFAVTHLHLSYESFVKMTGFILLTDTKARFKFKGAWRSFRFSLHF